MLNEQTYLDLMTPFLSFLRQTVRPVGNELAYYGTGESAHWPVQSNFNVAGALGVLATTPHELPVSKDELLETALRLFRYNLATHITGSRPATDGKSWGNTWIAILGLERMTHGINALEPFFSSADRDRFRTLRLNESDWLLSEYPVVAGMTASSGKNKPESNIWNGGFLLRAAMDYPDAPNRDAYLEKACSFLLNGLSHPLDAASETMFHGKPLREWHKGFNFTPGYSLDHHGYMNVGYSVICLSNLAMLHFNFKERGQTPPPELYHHVRDLWDVVRNFIFADGRLLRIGGDTRARYCYCQNYLLPILLFVQDLFGETDSASKEAQSSEKNASGMPTALSSANVSQISGAEAIITIPVWSQMPSSPSPAAHTGGANSVSSNRRKRHRSIRLRNGRTTTIAQIFCGPETQSVPPCAEAARAPLSSALRQTAATSPNGAETALHSSAVTCLFPPASPVFIKPFPAVSLTREQLVGSNTRHGAKARGNMPLPKAVPPRPLSLTAVP